MRQNLPQHVAIIPDGNRRWAKTHNLPSPNGHLKGRLRFREISQAAFDMGIPYFTFWAMSEDNFKKRSETEIYFLTSLLKEELNSKTMDRLFKNQIRFRVLGNWSELAYNMQLVSLIRKFEEETRTFQNNNLTLMFVYDGKNELFKTLFYKVSTFFCFEDIRKAAYWTKDLPPIDLLIRTGEEMPGWLHNSSGFMMLHTTDSEIHSSPTLWPDFSVKEFEKIIDEYGKRERKFGS